MQCQPLHLGNIRVVLTDVVEKPSANVYLATVAKQIDYYPFEMIMDRRSTSTAGCRYGYNGKENDDDVKGEGNQHDYDAWMFDPRIGRWLRPDPLENETPSWSAYRAFFNSPVNLDEIEVGDVLFVGQNIRQGPGVLIWGMWY